MKRKDNLAGAAVATIKAALASAERGEWERVQDWLKRAGELVDRKAAGQ